MYHEIGLRVLLAWIGLTGFFLFWVSPFLMQQTLAPLPRWSAIMFVVDGVCCKWVATARRMKAYEIPWKPYLRSLLRVAILGSIG